MGDYRQAVDTNRHTMCLFKFLLCRFSRPCYFRPRYESFSRR